MLAGTLDCKNIHLRMPRTVDSIPWM